jgi:hypothetical protein
MTEAEEMLGTTLPPRFVFQYCFFFLKFLLSTLRPPLDFSPPLRLTTPHCLLRKAQTSGARRSLKAPRIRDRPVSLSLQ